MLNLVHTAPQNVARIGFDTTYNKEPSVQLTNKLFGIKSSVTVGP